MRERFLQILSLIGSFLVISNTENTALAERLLGDINGLLNLDLRHTFPSMSSFRMFGY